MGASTTDTDTAASASAKAAAHPATTPSRQVTFLIDEDLLPACQDQAQAMSLSFAEWVQQAANESLRQYLGI